LPTVELQVVAHLSTDELWNRLFHGITATDNMHPPSEAQLAQACSRGGARGAAAAVPHGRAAAAAAAAAPRSLSSSTGGCFILPHN
jgi:hypothetical protein